MDLRLVIVIAALFAVGAAIIALAPLLLRGRDSGPLWRLYGTEFVIVGAVLAAAAHPASLIAGLALLGLRAQYEYAELHGLHLARGALAVDLAAGAAVVGGGCLVGSLGPLAVAAALVIATTRLATHGVRPAGLAAAAVVFPVLPIAVFCLIAALPQGPTWILFLFIVIETNDSFALLFGKLYGKRKAFPTLSPNKTVAGLVMGVLCAAAVGLAIAVLLLEIPVLPAAGLVAVAVAACVAGDLFTSALKRRVGRREFAPLLPPHGGVLDIYDSFIFAAPFLYAAHRLVLG